MKAFHTTSESTERMLTRSPVQGLKPYQHASGIPVLRMITMAADGVEARARALGERLGSAGWSVALTSGASAIGGGSAPGIELPTVLLAIERVGLTASALDAALRALDPPVVARIADDTVVLDLRTVDPGEDERLAKLLLTALSSS